jgi:hypothetical protein
MYESENENDGATYAWAKSLGNSYATNVECARPHINTIGTIRSIG